MPSLSGLGPAAAGFVISAAFVVSSGAVEVFIDATRGSVQKIPIAVFPFQEGLSLNGQVPLEVLKADLRRSLLFDVADLEKLGIKAGGNSAPDDESRRRAGEAGWAVQVWGSILPRGPPRSRSGIERIVRTFAVTSSPRAPSPRVAPRSSRPSA